MLSAKKLAEELAKTGTGKDKLDLIQTVNHPDQAIELLKKANYFATVRKAEAIVAADNSAKPAPAASKPEKAAEPAKDTKPAQGTQTNAKDDKQAKDGTKPADNSAKHNDKK